MAAISDRDFLRLVNFVRDRFGINLEHKRQLIDARLAFDLSRRGYAGFEPFVAKILANPEGEECQRMINKLSTNFTFFFREADYGESLCGPVLTELAKRGRTKLRLWSAACSSGQEAYSAAMMLEARRNLYGPTFDYEIVGTDINTDMLAMAAKGVYPPEELEHVPLRYRPYIGLLHDRGFQISESLRRKVTWRYENLLDQTAQNSYDVILCRNVMIYFTPQLRRDMTRKLHSALRPGGYLYTGATESIDLERRYFRYISPAFYQKSDPTAVRREP